MSSARYLVVANATEEAWGVPRPLLPPVQNKKPDNVKETEMHLHLRRQGASRKFQKVWRSLREKQVFTGDDNPNQILEAQGDRRHFKRRVGRWVDTGALSSWFRAQPLAAEPSLQPWHSF